MENPILLRVEGSVQGLMTEGAASQESVGCNENIFDHDEQAIVKAFSHNVMIAKNATTGQPSGQRVHNPVVITKMLDKSSPLFFNALTTGETLKNVEVKWYRTSNSANLEHYYTIVLEDALITNIDLDVESLAASTENQPTPLEKVSFSYRKISVRHETASTSGEDDWKRGVGV